MRNAPAYPAERFPGDFLSALLAGALVGGLLGLAGWWLSRRYLLTHYPGHPELLSAAIVVGLVDGLLLGILASAAWFAARLWRSERQERKHSDTALRRELRSIADAPPDTGPRKQPGD